MVAKYGLGKTGIVKFVVVGIALLAAGNGFAQGELRKTFFKDADAAKAAADVVEAEVYAPKSYESGMREYRSAEDYLKRGRNIEYVRSNAADAVQYFRTSAKAAELAQPLSLRPSKAARTVPTR